MAFLSDSFEVRLKARGGGSRYCHEEIVAALNKNRAFASLASGTVTLLLKHTSASLALLENWDPTVLEDADVWLAKVAPDGGAELYKHYHEGPDDMSGHLKTLMVGVSLSVPVRNGRLMLGNWQGFWLLEHRTSPHDRTVAVNVMGVSK